MRDRIIEASIECLRRDGLRFSVDELAARLRISKKTIYRHFPDKEALARAIYETYYAQARRQAQEILSGGGEDVRAALLRLYYDSRVMQREEIFNKFALNASIRAYAHAQGDALWEEISSPFEQALTEGEREATRLIVDGALGRLYAVGAEPDAVLERLVRVL